MRQATGPHAVIVSARRYRGRRVDIGGLLQPYQQPEASEFLPLPYTGFAADMGFTPAQAAAGRGPQTPCE